MLLILDNWTHGSGQRGHCCVSDTSIKQSSSPMHRQTSRVLVTTLVKHEESPPTAGLFCAHASSESRAASPGRPAVLLVPRPPAATPVLTGQSESRIRIGSYSQDTNGRPATKPTHQRPHFPPCWTTNPPLAAAAGRLRIRRWRLTPYAAASEVAPRIGPRRDRRARFSCGQMRERTRARGQRTRARLTRAARRVLLRPRLSYDRGPLLSFAPCQTMVHCQKMLILCCFAIDTRVFALQSS